MNAHLPRSIFCAIFLTSILSTNIAAAQIAPVYDITNTTGLNVTAGDSTDFGYAYSSNDYNKTFLNQFTFKIQDQTNLASFFGSIKLGKSDLSFSSFDLYKKTGNDLTLVASGAPQQSGTFDLWMLNAGNLTENSQYSLNIGGKVVGTAGGSFGGTIVVSSVPEPETWGMLVAGLIVVGYVIRRRNGGTSVDITGPGTGLRNIPLA